MHGELLKLGIEVSQSTVAKYMARQRKPPSQIWRTFLNNHVKQLVAMDFFVVPTVTFQVLYVFIVLAHDRRRLLHFNVTAHPTSEWTAQQIAEVFPWDSAPRYLLHDRNSIYEGSFRQRVRGMAIEEVLTAPRSPWQNPYRAFRRLNTPRMPRPHHGTQRIFSPSHSEILFSVLSACSHASGVG